MFLLRMLIKLMQSEAIYSICKKKTNLRTHHCIAMWQGQNRMNPVEMLFILFFPRKSETIPQMEFCVC